MKWLSVTIISFVILLQCSITLQESFVMQNPRTTALTSELMYGNGQYVGIGSHGLIEYSEDMNNWQFTYINLTLLTGLPQVISLQSFIIS